MKKIYILALLALGICDEASCDVAGIQDAPSVGTGHTQVTRSLSKSKNANQQIGVADLGISFNEILSRFEYDSTQESDGYLMVQRKGKTIFSLNDKNNLSDKIVRQIIIASPTIGVDGDIHVGMSVEELLKRFPNLSLELDYEADSEYFAPPSLEQGTLKYPDARIFFHVAASNGGHLSRDKEGQYPTKRFSTKGHIRYIHILVTGLR
jgi:hypothetical protein